MRTHPEPQRNVGLCFCNDGSLAAAVIFQSPLGLQVRSLSTVRGQGDGKYETPIEDGWFSTVLAANSFSDLAGVAMERDGLWWAARITSGEGVVPVIERVAAGERDRAAALARVHGLTPEDWDPAHNRSAKVCSSRGPVHSPR